MYYVIMHIYSSYKIVWTGIEVLLACGQSEVGRPEGDSLGAFPGYNFGSRCAKTYLSKGTSDVSGFKREHLIERSNSLKCCTGSYCQLLNTSQRRLYTIYDNSYHNKKTEKGRYMFGTHSLEFLDDWIFRILGRRRVSRRSGIRCQCGSG